MAFERTPRPSLFAMRCGNNSFRMVLARERGISPLGRRPLQRLPRPVALSWAGLSWRRLGNVPLRRTSAWRIARDPRDTASRRHVIAPDRRGTERPRDHDAPGRPVVHEVGEQRAGAGLDRAQPRALRRVQHSFADAALGRAACCCVASSRSGARRNRDHPCGGAGVASTPLDLSTAAAMEIPARPY